MNIIAYVCLLIADAYRKGTVSLFLVKLLTENPYPLPSLPSSLRLPLWKTGNVVCDGEGERGGTGEA